MIINLDIADELISSEQLQTFCVVEMFCEICEDLTSHHIDDDIKKPFKIDNKEQVAPISSHQCVVCRENEEKRLI